MSSESKLRSKELKGKAIALSISHEKDQLLKRGMGFDHLKEMVIKLAQPLLRHGANIAYGGNWDEREDNFTYVLLNLISAEREDYSGAEILAEQADSEPPPAIGRLLNYAAWPHYRTITPRIEAKWVNTCSIIRVTQEDAGLIGDEIVRDWDAPRASRRRNFNQAVVLSVMRRLILEGRTLKLGDTGRSERIPPAVARVLLSGKVESYSGFIPGIFEEALSALRKSLPVYILGGFGGAAGCLARAVLAQGDARPDELKLEWHEARNAKLREMLAHAKNFRWPSDIQHPKDALDDLFEFIRKGRQDPSAALQTGLDGPDTRQLLETSDIDSATQLVYRGLSGRLGLQTNRF
ncbi:hypothetical protein [Dongia sedimenti]|uniref:Uncharacterized protein n=1 Tax=Dongia sedimenti TaxID=3064282 RepID=A0ABU0YX90_9PROT|nr:hypothetical protein [Rhodospirillaceae bacterium R-7]